jgi:hypothetical protein
MGFVVNKMTLGQFFFEYFGFLCQYAFHRLLHNHHLLSSGAGTIGQTVAAVTSGLSLTPRKKKYSLRASSVTEDRFPGYTHMFEGHSERN